MIYENLLALKEAFARGGGKVVRITLDKEGNSALRNELDVSVACSKMLFGIIVDQTKECPTCGQEIVNEN